MMMWCRALVAVGFLSVVRGDIGGSLQKLQQELAGNGQRSTSKQSKATASQKTGQQQHQQDNNREQRQQHQQKQQGHFKKYIEEYVPAEFQKAALEGAKANQNQQNSHNSDSTKDGAGQGTLNLLEVAPDDSLSSSASKKSSQTASNYEQYINKYAGGSKGGSQEGSGNYQQYLKKYAGDASGEDYQKFINEYGGGDNGYQRYADYQKYIKRYSEHSNQIQIGSAHDAKTKTQLDEWRSSEKQNVMWYIPAAYSQYADNNIDRQYRNRLNELEHPSTQGIGGAGDTSASATINLLAIESHKERKHMNATELRAEAEGVVLKAEQLGVTLTHAASDKAAMQAGAARPANNVAASFTHRKAALETSIKNLQQQAKSGQTGTDFAHQLHDAIVEVNNLKSDELRALDRAHREANDAARNAARGTQTEVRREARQVWSMSDEMARKDSHYQDLTNKLQNRVENAADVVENQSEELARRTQENLQNRLEKARDTVRNEAQRQSQTLNAAHTMMEANAHKAHLSAKPASNPFLAQSDAAMYYRAPLAYIAAFAAACACLVFFVKNCTRRIDLNHSMLG